MKIHGLSLVIFSHNHFDSLPALLEQIDKSLLSKGLPYEVILMDKAEASEDQTVIRNLSSSYPLTHSNQHHGQSKSAQLIKTFSKTKYDLIGILDLPLGYSADIIPEMIKKLENDQADIMIVHRNKMSWSSRFFGVLADGANYDIHSGLKIFKKEIVERLYPHFSPISFDLEFLAKAADAGYVLEKFDVEVEHSSLVPKKSHDSFWKLTLSHFLVRYLRSDVIPFHPDTVAAKGKGFHYKGQEFVHHSNLKPSQSAIHRLSGMQMFILLGILVEVVIFFIINWHVALVILIAMLTCLYFADLLFNLFLIYRSFSKPAEVQIEQSEIDDVNDWPTYTILCPLYKEWQVVPQFVTAMSHLDYPKSKLQVMLLLEEDDKDTIKEINNYDLPSYFQTVIVPDSKPKTKPKASNYGLLQATGEYIVIYDAEDVPDPLQLKKAVVAFRKSGRRIKCIQAKLNFYNPHQNLLTRVFTAEYSLWFDLVLTGLQSIHAPIPLGGTSNHFRKADLVKLNGWDSFNVTEDCDLGMRLVKAGFQTAVINSTTLEEANSDMANWFSQRTRWIKGYMQTYLIHMRDPHQFLKNWREPHAITFQLVVGGKVLSMFINPLMWVITLMYFMFRANIGTFIESFFPAPVLYMGVISLLLGNFLYIYYYMIGCAKHGHHELVKYGVFIPFYWLAMSVAAWMAFYKLIVAPHYWAKTKHGLHLNNAKAVNHASQAIGQQSLVDKDLTHVRLNPAI